MTISGHIGEEENPPIRINYAVNIDDLRTPPGNRLERLIGDRDGQYSIRVSRGWRICFVWQDGDAFEVELSNHYD